MLFWDIVLQVFESVIVGRYFNIVGIDLERGRKKGFAMVFGGTHAILDYSHPCSSLSADLFARISGKYLFAETFGFLELVALERITGQIEERRIADVLQRGGSSEIVQSIVTRVMQYPPDS